jgi:hypothetical protein
MTSLARAVGEINREVYLTQRASDFIELQRVSLLARAGKVHPIEIARLRNTSGRVIDLLEKGAISPITTTDPGAAAILANLSQAFIGSVGLFGAFDQIMAAGGFVNVPLRTRTAVVTLAGSAYEVDEAKAKPISKLALASGQLHYWKTVAITVVTAELMRSIEATAAGLIADELRRAVGYTADQLFTQLLIQNTTGVPSTPSSGTSATAFMNDLQNALGQIHYGQTSKLFFIVPSGFYKHHLMLMRDSGGWIMTNGMIQDIRVVRSDVLTDHSILLDGTQIAAASDVVSVDQSSQTSLMLDDAPTNPPGFPQLTSLFQNNLIAARVERYVGAEVLRHDALCLLTGVAPTG